MSTHIAPGDVTVFSTCRSSIGHRGSAHMRTLLDIAQWSDEAGYRGALIYTDCTSLDPWIAAAAALANTSEFVPLVAVQPMDMTPFALARAISSIAHLYGRCVDVNFVSGGFGRDLAMQGDRLTHDMRYDRLIEYVTVVRTLLAGEIVNHAGDYYRVRRARLTAPVPPDLRPTFYVSGSSPASLDAGEALGIGQLSFPVLPQDLGDPGVRKNRFGSGISIGIIAREDRDHAWRLAHERFPADPDGAERMKLLLKAGDSSWQPQLAAVSIADEAPGQTYWLVPFRYHHTFCPYLVGSYDDVAQAVATYLRAGIRTFVLDIPRDREDLVHAGIALERGRTRVDADHVAMTVRSPSLTGGW